MLSRTAIEQFALRFQTSELNVMREYTQNLLLSHLYRQPKADKLAFKGGTALRLLFRSPRFSKDLDFSSTLAEFHIRKMLDEMLDAVSHENLPCKILENKATSGGYFSLYQFEMHQRKVAIEFNISLRTACQGEPILVTSPLYPPYQIIMMNPDDLAGEKMSALLRRKKPRDFFDLYFLLRERRGIKAIIPLKNKLIAAINDMDARALKRELKMFLPLGQQQILKKFPTILASELARL